MAACTFFGHRECPEDIRPRLLHALEDLIEHHGVDVFYVGNQGSFDRLAHSCLLQLQEKYPHIRYGVVLAYMPKAGEVTPPDTMLPEGIELAHPRYAISRRNDWMLTNAQYVVTYVTRTWGGAWKFASKARRQGKQILPLA